MTGEARIREFLTERGVRPQVVQGGVAGLVKQWEEFADTLEAGYQLDLSSYLNDLDVRQLLAEALALADVEQRQALAARIEQADARVRRATEPIPFCVWGERVLRDEEWTPEANWWYFLRPLKAARELRQELDELAAEFE